MIAKCHDLVMDTHLTPINEDIVREREEALRAARERAANTYRDRSRDVGGDGAARAGRPTRGGLDMLVVTLFAVLAAGFVSLVVTTLQVG